MENNFENVELFKEEFWDNVSEKVVSTKYLDENIDFTDSLTFDLYKLYLNCQRENREVDLKIICKITEYFFSNLFKFSAGNKNIEDEYFEY